MNPHIEQLLMALDFFKDWSNFLLGARGRKAFP